MRSKVQLKLLALALAPIILVSNEVRQIIAVRHPMIISSIWWFGVLIAAFATEVWKRLREKWIDETASWIDSRTRGFFFYRSRYERRAYSKCRSIDIRGLKTRSPYDVAVSNVFVDLRIAPQPPHRARREPIVLDHIDVAGDRRNIWSFLKDQQLTSHNFVILGSAGSGKSTLMRHIVLTLTGSRKKRPFKRIPILCEISQFRDELSDEKSATLENLIDSLVRGLGAPAPPGWIPAMLQRDTFLLLMDGLDEVADEEQRKRVARWVQRQIHAHPTVRFIVTSRPYGYTSELSATVSVLEIQPFTADQVRLCSERWYITTAALQTSQSDKEVRPIGLAQASAFLGRIYQSRALIQMASNPLLLWMMLHVHLYRGALPGHRADLYSEICDVFLGRRHDLRGVAVQSRLKVRNKQHVLQVLALEMMKREARFISRSDAAKIIRERLSRIDPQLSPESFLCEIEETSSMIVERSVGEYDFAHKSFKEYLTAIEIADREAPEVLLEKLTVNYWRETIRLYAAQSPASMTTIVDACISKSELNPDCLALAAECVLDDDRVPPEVREKVMRCCSGDLNSFDIKSRIKAAEVHLALRMRRFTPLEARREGIDIDHTLLTQAEYELFIMDGLLKCRFYQPDHWTGHSPIGTGNHPLAGVRANDAAVLCQWLTERFSFGEWTVRLPTTEEAQIAVDISNSSSTVGYWARGDDGTYLIRGLGRPQGKCGIDTVIQCCARDTERIVENDTHRAPIVYAPNETDGVMAKMRSGPPQIFLFEIPNTRVALRRVGYLLKLLGTDIEVGVDRFNKNQGILDLDGTTLPPGESLPDWSRLQPRIRDWLTRPFSDASELHLLGAELPVFQELATRTAVENLRADPGAEGPPTIHRSLLRISILALATFHRCSQLADDKVAKLVDDLVRLTILELRIRGTVSASEGVRLVIEHPRMFNASQS